MNKSKTPPPHFNLDRLLWMRCHILRYSVERHFVQSDLQRFIHTFTHQRRSQSPAVRVRRHAQTHYDTRSTQGSIYRPSGYTLTRSTSWASSMLYPEGSEPSPFREAGPHDNINTMTLGKDGITHIKENHTPPSTQNPARSQRRR